MLSTSDHRDQRDQRDRDLTSTSLVLVISSLECGGAERVLSNMANYWAAKGCSVTLATWSGPDTPDFYCVDSAVERAWLDVGVSDGSNRGKLLSHIRRIRKLRKLLNETKPDAVLSFIDWSNVLTIIAVSGLRVQTVISERVHGAYYDGVATFWRICRKLLYTRADVVVAQTREVADWLTRECHLSSVQVIPNPLRTLPITNSERECFVLAVGRLSRQKGFDLLMRAFASIQDEFRDWRLKIVGAGGERASLVALRGELGLESRVDIRPPVEDIESLFARAGLVVQPSRYEGFPNVLLEAMGMGAPVISADCPSGPGEIVEDGTNGRLVPVDDIQSLANAMAELMADSKLRRLLGERARDVRERYRQDKIMLLWERELFS